MIGSCANLSAALAYAARGWHVFPLRPGDKRPAAPAHREADCDRRDPRCRAGHVGWEQRATTDPDRIRKGWTINPRFGIGIACGPSGLLVVDLDMPKPGEPGPARWTEEGATRGVDVLALIADDHGKRVPATWTTRTVSGGEHLYFTTRDLPADVELRNTNGSRGGLGWLVDTRAHGGYVVAAPTAIGGDRYEVTDARDPIPVPGWLAGALQGLQSTHRATQEAASAVQPTGAAPTNRERLDGYVRAALTGEATKVASAGEGGRNHAVFCAAVALGQLVAGGVLDEHTARATLLGAAAGHYGKGKPPFTPAEAEASIASGFTTGARQPRSASTARTNPRSVA